jgi:DNA-binding transcriptional regulator YdaS (Cro superfamily)
MKNEALIRAVAKFDTLKAFADALSTPERPVTYQMVQQWMTGSVPAEYCPDVERIADYSVSRVDLRPKDGHRIWPEIAGKKLAKHKRRKEDKEGACNTSIPHGA